MCNGNETKRGNIICTWFNPNSLIALLESVVSSPLYSNQILHISVLWQATLKGREAERNTLNWVLDNWPGTGIDWSLAHFDFVFRHTKPAMSYDP